MMTSPVMNIPFLNVDRFADAAWERTIFDYYQDDPTQAKIKVRKCRVRLLVSYVHNQFLDQIQEKVRTDPTLCAHCGHKIPDDRLDELFESVEGEYQRAFAARISIASSFWSCSNQCYWGQCAVCREKKKTIVDTFLQLEGDLEIDAIYAALSN
jgi:hypothetical protein